MKLDMAANKSTLVEVKPDPFKQGKLVVRIYHEGKMEACVSDLEADQVHSPSRFPPGWVKD